MIRTLLRSAIFLLADFLLQAGYADELTICSPHGDVSAAVTSRVDAASAGKISAGKPISLRKEPADTCQVDAACSIYKAPPLHAATAGVELGRNQSWVCVGVPGKRPLDVWFGWVPIDRWQRSDGEQQSSNRWLGVWQNDHAKIAIQSFDGRTLEATGNALWVGGVPGTSHFGDFRVSGIPENGVISTDAGYGETGCQVAMRVVGDFLFAADNQRCGGMNVTFDGIYRFRHR